MNKREILLHLQKIDALSLEGPDRFYKNRYVCNCPCTTCEIHYSCTKQFPQYDAVSFSIETFNKVKSKYPEEFI